MSSSNPSNKTWKIIIGTLAALLLLVVVFNLLRYTPVFYSASRTLKSEAATTKDQQKAAGDYQLAWFLNPSDHDSARKLAALYLQQDNADAAIAVLKELPAGESGVELAALLRQIGDLKGAESTIYRTLRAKESAAAYAEKAMILLEKGEGSGAVYNAERANQLENSDTTKILLGSSYAATDKKDDLSKLVSATTGVAALEALQKAEQGKYQLAAVLYSLGLLRSSERVLIAAQPSTAPEYRLLGVVEVNLAKNDNNYWAKAKDPLEKAVKADPANLESHQLLFETYVHLNMPDQAAEQKALISQLESGNV